MADTFKYQRTTDLGLVMQEVRENRRDPLVTFDAYPDLGVRAACLKRLGMGSTMWLTQTGKPWCEERLRAIAAVNSDPIGQPLLDFYFAHSFHDPEEKGLLAAALDFAVTVLAGASSFPEFSKSVVGVLVTMPGRAAYPQTAYVCEYIKRLLCSICRRSSYNGEDWTETSRALRAIRVLGDRSFIDPLADLQQAMGDGRVGTYYNLHETDTAFRKTMHAHEIREVMADILRE